MGHLLRATTAVVTYLEQPSPRDAPIAAPEYYATILATSDIDDPLHVGIRDRAYWESVRGPVALLSDWNDSVSALTDHLRSEPEQRTLSVAGDLVMFLDDYLVTRLVEAVVHSDDLAMGVRVATPIFPARAMELIFDHLLEVARLRHGDLAVLRAFTRKERDDIEALVVL